MQYRISWRCTYAFKDRIRLLRANCSYIAHFRISSAELTLLQIFQIEKNGAILGRKRIDESCSTKDDERDDLTCLHGQTLD